MDRFFVTQIQSLDRENKRKLLLQFPHESLVGDMVDVVIHDFQEGEIELTENAAFMDYIARQINKNDGRSRHEYQRVISMIHVWAKGEMQRGYVDTEVESEVWNNRLAFALLMGNQVPHTNFLPLVVSVARHFSREIPYTFTVSRLWGDGEALLIQAGHDPYESEATGEVWVMGQADIPKAPTSETITDASIEQRNTIHAYMAEIMETWGKNKEDGSSVFEEIEKAIDLFDPVLQDYYPSPVDRDMILRYTDALLRYTPKGKMREELQKKIFQSIERRIKFKEFSLADSLLNICESYAD
jgi:hypothetical protein